MANTDPAHRYRDRQRLGAGGMGTVTLAEDTLLGRSVALKRLHGSGDRRGTLRLKREALVGASLNHPNLVSIFDAQIQENGDVVIVMEYVPGETLSQMVRARGGLPPQEALGILRELAAALDAIHERGIVHRDVKPANVLLGREGVVKLADLGVADVADRTHITTSGAIVGSFSYMAPEQLDGAPPSSRMDIYALAAVAYELLSGEKAHPESNPLALAHAIATQPPPDLRKVRPQVPAEAAAVLQRGMSADPSRRPASAGELMSRLERAFEPERATQSEARAAPAAKAPAPAAPRAAAPPRRPAPPRGAAVARRRALRLVPALVELAVLVTAGLVLAAIESGGSGRARGAPAGQTSGAARTAARAKATGSSHTTTTPAESSTPSAVPPTTSGAQSGAGAASAASPAGVVEAFYEAAGAHRYATAWALADSNMRNQVGGYSGFQSLMSPVRSIIFHRAQTLGGAGFNSATVALATTSVQTDRTQQCSGTAHTVRSGGSWLLDGISISCS